MLNFLPRDQHRVPLLLIKTWAFWSVAAPIGMTGLCLLLLVGFAALVGAPPLEVATDFLVDVLEPLARVSAQLWLTAFLMMVVCYGVGRQLIRQTLGGPLSTPLAALAASLRKMVFLSALALSFTEPPAARQSGMSPFPVPYAGTQVPPMALLAGTAPLLE